jgi:hypothetical protein
MQIRGSGRWQQRLFAMGLGTLLLAFWGDMASAQTPTRARLSISSANKGGTQYPAIRLPDGSITGYNYDTCFVLPGLKLKLEVWFGETGNPVDVTNSPGTSFSSEPDRRFLRSEQPNVFYLDVDDAGQTVTYRGSYTAGDVTVTDSFTIKMELFQAPSFYDAGRNQQKILQSIDALAHALNGRFRDPQVDARVREIRLFVSLWWSGRLALPIASLGDRLVRLGAPRGVLIQLSRLALEMQSAGLIRIHEGADGFTGLSFTSAHPPWLSVPEFVLGSCGPIIVSWYGLGR